MGVPKRTKLQYLLSFLFDTLVDSRSSKFNPVLDVKYHEGGYVLDAKTVNFSFGTLNRVFQLAFDHLKIGGRPIKSALILGYGAGSVAALLNERLNEPQIVGVEIDAEVIAIAREYFELGELDNVSVVEMDATTYVQTCEEKLDLIAVDLFDDDKVPGQFYEKSFLESLKTLLNPGGMLVFNASVQSSGQEIAELSKAFQEIFNGHHTLSLQGNNVLVWEDATRL
jgi:spermidine synthase